MSSISFRSAVLGCSIAMLSFSAGAATYYVDSVSGVDTLNGTTPATAWKTLTKVNAITFQPGDQVLFKRGCSWTGTLTPKGSGTSGNPLVFDAYGTGDKPIINGNGASNAVMLWSKRYFTFQNFQITNDAAAEGYRAGIRLTFVGTPGTTPPSPPTLFSSVRILNNEIHHVRGYTNRALYDIYATAALYVEMSDYQGAQTVVDDLLIEGNEIHDNRCIGIEIKPAGNYAGREDLWMTNLVIRSNVFRQTGGDHMVINGAKGFLVESNAGYDGGILAAPNSNLWQAGMWACYFTKDGLYQFNEVARTVNQFLPSDKKGDSTAFDVDYGTYGSHIFQYNYTHENAGGPLLVMPPENGKPATPKAVIFRYNLSVNDGHNNASSATLPIYTTPGTNTADVYNNVFYTNRPEGIRILDSVVNYYNNVFHAPNGVYGIKPTFSNNCYFGHSTSAVDPYEILADPKFVGPLPVTGNAPDGYANIGNVYKLQSSSPCINQGRTITTPVANGGRDFWNNPLYAGSYADIGAHEVAGGSAAPPSAHTLVDNPPASSKVYTGAWQHLADATYYNSTKSVSSTVGNYMEYTFTGTNVILWAKIGPGIGKMDISVDGGPATLVNGYTLTTRIHPVFQVSGLTNGTHTVRVTVATKDTNATGNAIGLDYFEHAGSVPPPAAVIIDNPSAAYIGTWTHSVDANYYNSTKSVSSTIGDYAQFAFSGTNATLYTKIGPSLGKLNISIDGGPATSVNCYSPVDAFQVPVYVTPTLSAGSHTLRATVVLKDAASGGNWIGVDYLRYQP